MELRLKSSEVLVHSTGVIGVPVPRGKIRKGIGLGVKGLSLLGGPDFAEAILTTDLVEKTSFRTIKAGGARALLAGFAKGSGMIHPNLATMLVYILTDAAISKGLLKKALRESVEFSFNRITVDGDTSPSDSVVADRQRRLRK